MVAMVVLAAVCMLSCLVSRLPKCLAGLPAVYTPPSLPCPPSLDFLPIFVWVLLQCECGRAELEAEFMWGLVHPSLLNGEGGYYLTTLTSAVQVVKQLKFDNMALDEGKPENKVHLRVLHGGVVRGWGWGVGGACPLQ